MNERRKAPYVDYEGNELFEGDWIRHPNGDEAVIYFSTNRMYDKDPLRRWRAVYNLKAGERRMQSLWLGFQVDDKGQAVKVEGPTKVESAPEWTKKNAHKQ